MNEQQILWLIIGVVVLLIIIAIAVAVGRKRRATQREADRLAAEQLREDAAIQQERTRAEEENAAAARREAKVAEEEAHQLRVEAEERERSAGSSRSALDSQLREADRLDPEVRTNRDGERRDAADHDDNSVAGATAAGGGAVAGGAARDARPATTGDGASHPSPREEAVREDRGHQATGQQDAGHQDARLQEDLRPEAGTARTEDPRGPDSLGTGDAGPDVEPASGLQATQGSGRHAAPAPPEREAVDPRVGEPHAGAELRVAEVAEEEQGHVRPDAAEPREVQDVRDPAQDTVRKDKDGLLDRIRRRH